MGKKFLVLKKCGKFVKIKNVGKFVKIKNVGKICQNKNFWENSFNFLMFSFFGFILTNGAKNLKEKNGGK